MRWSDWTGRWVASVPPSSINSKHREVQRLSRTAKEIAAVIGEELIAVRESKPEGGLRRWVED